MIADPAVPEWIHVLLDLAGMFFIGSAFVWAIKTDTKVLATRMKTLEARLDKMDEVLEKLSDQKSRIEIVDERVLAQGKRLDEVIKQLAQVAMRFPLPGYNREPGS